MVKKVISFILLFVILVTTTTAGFAQGVSTQGSVNVELSPLNYLIEHTLQHNDQLKELDRQIAESEINLKDAKKAYDSVKNIDISFRTGTVSEVLNKHGYNLKYAQNTYDMLLQNKEKAKKSLELSVIQMYTSIVQMENQKKYLGKTRDMLSKQVQITEIRHNLKMATDLDVVTVKDQLSKLDNQLIQLETTQKNLIRDLKKLANIPEDYVIEFVDGFTFPEAENYDVNQMVAKALDQRLDVKELKNLIELQQLKVDVYGKVFSKASSTYKKEPLVLESLEKQMEDKLQNVRNDIADRITNLKLSRDAYFLAEDAYKNAQEKNRISKIKYDLGMISSIEMLDSELALMEAYNKTREALFKYINEKMELELVCTYGPVTVK